MHMANRWHIVSESANCNKIINSIAIEDLAEPTEYLHNNRVYQRSIHHRLHSTMMLRLLVSALSLSSAAAFVAVPSSSTAITSTSCIHSTKAAGEDVVMQQAFAVGSFVEFVEKSRTHIGKIDTVEHKTSGGARYQ